MRLAALLRCHPVNDGAGPAHHGIMGHSQTRIIERCLDTAAQGLSQSFWGSRLVRHGSRLCRLRRWRWAMILNALVEQLKRRSKNDFKGRHYEAALILQAVSWYLRYPLSYRDIEKLFLERGLEWTTRPPIVGCWDTATLPGP
jgi:hypothetical protein